MEKQQPTKTGMFSRKKPMPEKNPLYDDLKELTGNLRVLEERHINLRKKAQVIEQNMLLSHKRYWQKIRDASDSLQELKKAVRKLEENLERVFNNLSGCASKQDVKAIQKYIYMWNPSSFVQRSEIKKLIQEKEKL